MSITKEQFEEWKTHPVTIEVYKEIKAAKKSLEEDLGAGVTIDNDSADKTLGLTNRVVGQIAGLNQLLGLVYEDDENIVVGQY